MNDQCIRSYFANLQLCGILTDALRIVFGLYSNQKKLTSAKISVMAVSRLSLTGRKKFLQQLSARPESRQTSSDDNDTHPEAEFTNSQRHGRPVPEKTLAVQASCDSCRKGQGSRSGRDVPSWRVRAV
jgi:hypothetical protein